MKNKIRELTDRNNGMGNAKREKKYQNYVRGWVEYFKLADMKGLLQVITNKIIAKLGYTSMLDYYLVVYEN